MQSCNIHITEGRENSRLLKALHVDGFFLSSYIACFLFDVYEILLPSENALIGIIVLGDFLI